ncbi:LysR family transcriptional regulator [Ensifer sp. 4252]|uniref:LysR family transcriptional regulator n=1 Tax=Ensifer sp. 4252 TaxID=3373915 RepID=UPI003D1FFCAA
MRRFHISSAMFRSFQEIVREGSVTKAANRLHSTQSTLSHQLQKLEAELGCPLFDRKPRRMELTAAGDFFLAQARTITDAMDSIDRYFRAPENRTRISIGIVNDCFRPFIISSLSEFYRDFPKVTVDFRTGSSEKLTRQVNEGEVELAIVRDLSSGTKAGHVLWSEQLLWAGGPAYRHGDGALPMIFMPAPCVYRQYALNMFATNSTPYRIAVECDSWGTFESSVRSGAGISLMTSDVCQVCGVPVEDDRLPPAPISHACLVAGELPAGSPTRALADRLIGSSAYLAGVA